MGGKYVIFTVYSIAARLFKGTLSYKRADVVLLPIFNKAGWNTIRTLPLSQQSLHLLKQQLKPHLLHEHL